VEPDRACSVRGAVSRPRGRILVVEDDPGIAQAMALILGGAGYEVRHAADGAAALRQLAAAGPPDLMLVDLIMPGMDGRTLLEHMGRDPRWSAIPFILLTALADSLRDPPPRGCRAILAKPFELQDLLDAVAGVLGPGVPPGA
jgi:CheY-like chemotaxis protein